jgi:hypothetical protein
LTIVYALASTFLAYVVFVAEILGGATFYIYFINSATGGGFFFITYGTAADFYYFDFNRFYAIDLSFSMSNFGF